VADPGAIRGGTGVTPPRLYTQSSGAGAPLVLLHGWGMNLAVFEALRTRLAQHYSVTVLDLPGHGRSPWPDDCTPEQQLQLIGAELPPQVTLIGWSLGGQLALQLAAQPARSVRRMVLMATTPRFVATSDWPHGLPETLLQQFAQQLEFDPAGTVGQFLELQVRADRAGAATLATLRASLERHGWAQPAALRADLALLASTDLRTMAPGVQVPALAIAGQADRITPPLAAAALVHLLPQAQLLELPRAGHAPFLSQGETVAASIRRFIEASA
jgi:pimeloyl-[acyl-carrier protein] methyl ester esterase